MCVCIATLTIHNVNMCIDLIFNINLQFFFVNECNRTVNHSKVYYLQILSSFIRLAANGLALVRRGNTTLARLLLGGCAGTTFFLRFLLGTIQINAG